MTSINRCVVRGRPLLFVFGGRWAIDTVSDAKNNDRN